jgi:hypothetical protein
MSQEDVDRSCARRASGKHPGRQISRTASHPSSGRPPRRCAARCSPSPADSCTPDDDGTYDSRPAGPGPTRSRPRSTASTPSRCAAEQLSQPRRPGPRRSRQTGDSARPHTVHVAAVPPIAAATVNRRIDGGSGLSGASRSTGASGAVGSWRSAGAPPWGATGRQHQPPPRLKLSRPHCTLRSTAACHESDRTRAGSFRTHGHARLPSPPTGGRPDRGGRPGALRGRVLRTACASSREYVALR